MPVVLIDGRPTTVTEEEARQLTKLSGNERETTRQAMQRAETFAEGQHYGSTGQQAIAGLEGLASGATIGLSDLLLDDEETRMRARYNPGTRLATELTGAIVPALLSGGTGAAASVAKLTPTALAASAGTRVAGALGRGLPTALAVEGAIQGAGTAASRAVLNDDPLTIEAVASGAGMGALFGAGLGVLSRGTTRAGLSAERRIATAQTEAAQSALSAELPALKKAAAAMSEIKVAARRSVDEVERVLNPSAMADHLKNLKSVQDNINVLGMGASKKAKKAAAAVARDAQADLRAAKSAMAAKQWDSAAAHMENYADNLDQLSKAFGAGVEIPKQNVVSTEKLAKVSMLEDMPTSPAELAAISDERATSYFTSLKEALAPANDELDTLRGRVVELTEAGLREAGVAPVSSSTDDIVDALAAFRVELKKTAELAKPAAKAGKTEKHSFLEFIKRSAAQSAARGASHVAKKSGANVVLSSLAYQSGAGIFGFLAAELMGLRAAATHHVDDLIAKMAPRAAKGLRRVAPVTEILRQSIMSPDKPAGAPKKQTTREAAKERVDELTKMAPTIHDVAYSAVEPVMTQSPQVAMQLSQQMLKGFQQMLAAAPKDPGGTHVGLQSDWLPSETQALTFASVTEAVCKPMDALDRMLQGDGDPAAAEALWAVYPSLMNEAAIRLVEKLPEIQEKTDLATRGALSTAFRVPLDGLLTQQSIAALQAQFIPANFRDDVLGKPGEEPKPARPNGRPPAVNSGSVQQTRTQSLQKSF